MKNATLTGIVALALLASGPAGAQDKNAKSTTTNAKPVVAHYQQAEPAQAEKRLEKKSKKKAVRNDHTREFWNKKFKFVSF